MSSTVIDKAAQRTVNKTVKHRWGHGAAASNRWKTMSQTKPTSPFAIRNIRLFIAFRVFFNARFYYPVFSILFLDFGLTLSQFAVLNAVWAGTIVLCEVPSGALADTLGRKNLLVFTGVLMVLEMALWALAPRQNPDLLFWILLVNRILSGLAEASASGADEALAYDSLKVQGDIKQWGQVLEKQMVVKSVGFVIVMIVGGAVYDPALMQRAVDFLGWGIPVTRETTLRFPIYLTLGMALLTLLTAFRMEDVTENASGDVSGGVCENETGCIPTIFEAFKTTLRTGRWIVNTPFVLVAILAGLLFDSAIRMVITMSSQYYRLILIPEALFGLIGSATAMLGFFVPRFARRLTENHTPAFNLGVMAVLSLVGLVGMTFFYPVFGLIPALVLFSNMFLLGFFLSHYLNRAARSDQRATVLSFRGLALNLGYGCVGIFYSLLLAFLRGQLQSVHPDVTGEPLKNAVFIASMSWFPGYLGIGLVGLVAFSAWRLRHSKEYRRVD